MISLPLVRAMYRFYIDVVTQSLPFSRRLCQCGWRTCPHAGREYLGVLVHCGSLSIAKALDPRGSCLFDYPGIGRDRRVKTLSLFLVFSEYLVVHRVDIIYVFLGCNLVTTRHG